jgi:hypothetical protein
MRADTRSMNIRSILAARTANKQLERELSAYISASDQNDLDAILARHSDQDAARIRRIVSAQRAERTRVAA